MTFTPLDDDTRTLVEIREEGWRENQGALEASYGNCQGWSQMLDALKAWVEHGINLREGCTSDESRYWPRERGICHEMRNPNNGHPLGTTRALRPQRQSAITSYERPVSIRWRAFFVGRGPRPSPAPCSGK